MPKQLSRDSLGNPIVKNGAFQYSEDDGSTILLDPEALQKNLAQSMSESTARAAEILSLKSALKAQGGTVNENVAQVNAAVSDNSDLSTSLQERDKDVRKLLFEDKLAVSPLFAGITPSTVLNPELAAERYGSNFKIERVDGALLAVGYDNKGIPIVDEQGKPGSVTECCKQLIESSPERDHILRASHSGSGSFGQAEIKSEKQGVSLLKAQYKDAMKTGNSRDAIMIKNRLAEKNIFNIM